MRSSFGSFVAAVVCGALSIGVGSALPASGRQVEPAAAEGTKAINRGLAFLQADAADWKSSRKCSSCHHGAMTLWALTEARRQGYPVEAAAVNGTAAWVRERLTGIDKPRDPRPGWSMINTVALYLAAMARSQPGQDLVTPEELERIATHVSRHLEDDGSVLTPATMWPPHPQNGPPPVFESREALTLWALLALPGSEGNAPAESARSRAGSYLASIPRGKDIQSADLRLALDARAGKPKKELRPQIDAILARQNGDGGWSQAPGLPSDAFATGQTLYFLNLAGVDRRRPEIRRGVALLAAGQQADGSWPMTSRAQPGARPMTHPEPIRHFGSCWAVLGLVRSVPSSRGRPRSHAAQAFSPRAGVCGYTG